MDSTNDANTAPASTQAQSKGIDIRDALSILSARSTGGGENLAANSKTITNEMKEMGQTIDIADQMEFAKPDAFKCECANPNALKGEEEDKSDDEKHEAMRQERAKRGEAIHATLQSLNVSELMAALFAAQEERVATYKVYEQGLSTILSSGNITTYPPLCAKVTATFSVLSDTINAVKSTLVEKHKRNDIGRTINQLQQYEGEKLNLTAAMHLEKLRLRNEELGLIFDGSDEASARLLKEGIQSLEEKVSSNVESINEVLEELRCIAAEEVEE